MAVGLGKKGSKIMYTNVRILNRIRMFAADFLEEVRMFKYFGTSVTRKNEISEEIKMKIMYCKQSVMWFMTYF